MAKIRVKERAQFSQEKMSKIALATAERIQLDLYCLSPGQSQKPHTHTDMDKVYYVLEGNGLFSLSTQEEPIEAGEAVIAPAGVEHGLRNDGAVPLICLVAVSPPPRH
jgi:quercetin dioxygenase-like cupin family protein